MSPADVGTFALTALVRHRLRTVLSLLGVAIGVAAVVSLTALGEGAVSVSFAAVSCATIGGTRAKRLRPKPTSIRLRTVAL